MATITSKTMTPPCRWLAPHAWKRQTGLNPKTGWWRMQSRETGLRRDFPDYQGI
jgi:hypothetical protein